MKINEQIMLLTVFLSALFSYTTTCMENAQLIEKEIYNNFSFCGRHEKSSLPIFVPGKKNIFLNITDHITADYLDNPHQWSFDRLKPHADSPFTSIAFSPNGEKWALVEKEIVSIWPISSQKFTQTSIPLTVGCNNSWDGSGALHKIKIPNSKNIAFLDNDTLAITEANSINVYDIKCNAYFQQDVYDAIQQKSLPNDSITAISTNNQCIYYVPSEKKLFIDNIIKDELSKGESMPLIVYALKKSYLPMDVIRVIMLCIKEIPYKQCIDLKQMWENDSALLLCKNTILAIEQSSDGKYIALIGGDCISVCNRSNGKVNIIRYAGYSAFHPNGKTIFVLDKDGSSIAVFDLETNKEIYKHNLEYKNNYQLGYTDDLGHKYNPEKKNIKEDENDKPLYKKLVFNENGTLLAVGLDKHCRMLTLSNKFLHVVEMAPIETSTDNFQITNTHLKCSAITTLLVGTLILWRYQR